MAEKHVSARTTQSDMPVVEYGASSISETVVSLLKMQWSAPAIDQLSSVSLLYQGEAKVLTTESRAGKTSKNIVRTPESVLGCFGRDIRQSEYWNESMLESLDCEAEGSSLLSSGDHYFLIASEKFRGNYNSAHTV